jgi:hypothetical protein
VKRSQSASARSRRYLLAGALLLAASIFAGAANADDFVIDQPVNQTNGGFQIDDDDTLTIGETGAINTDEDEENGIEAGSRNAFTTFGNIRTAGNFANAILVSNKGLSEISCFGP